MDTAGAKALRSKRVEHLENICKWFSQAGNLRGGKARNEARGDREGGGVGRGRDAQRS